MNEFKLIQTIKKNIPKSLQGELGIGDDADWIMSGNKKLLVCTDSISEGIDFLYSRTKPEWAGRKLIAINLSDMAAMAGCPSAFVVSLGIPSKIKEDWIKKFYKGILQLAQPLKLKCLGGDISGAKEFWASLTLLGNAADSLMIRSRAKMGDYIGVTGYLGGSILGRHLNFTPRLREGALLASSGVHCAIDISDGFMQDLEHLLNQSGVGAVIDMSCIPVDAAARKLSKKTRKDPIEHALTDGEDFELLFTASSQTKKKLDAVWDRKFKNVKLTWVGRILDKRHGVLFLDRGLPRDLNYAKKGFSHF